MLPSFSELITSISSERVTHNSSTEEIISTGFSLPFNERNPSLLSTIFENPKNKHFSCDISNNNNNTITEENLWNSLTYTNSPNSPTTCSNSSYSNGSIASNSEYIVPSYKSTVQVRAYEKFITSTNNNVNDIPNKLLPLSLANTSASSIIHNGEKYKANTNSQSLLPNPIKIQKQNKMSILGSKQSSCISSPPNVTITKNENKSNDVSFDKLWFNSKQKCRFKKTQTPDTIKGKERPKKIVMNQEIIERIIQLK
ncbi:hypothetical protein ABK040_009350 [Willaertia magna]